MAIIGGVRYTVSEVKLSEGDRLLFYSDGLSEMPIRHGNRALTIERMKRLAAEILEEDPAMPVSAIMERMIDKIARISREEVIPGVKNSSNDDVSLLCLEIENKANSHEVLLTPVNTEDLTGIKDDLYQKLRREWHRFGFASPETRLRPVLDEALLNAWTHGNKKNPNKAITLRWRYGNDFHLEIIDGGRGFDCTNCPDPRSVENRLNPSGRGLFLIRHYSDAVSWGKNGSHLRVYFRKTIFMDTAAKKAQKAMLTTSCLLNKG
jgi:anti-sigma regulatory factor (Ser/Thr protein kinase)